MLFDRRSMLHAGLSPASIGAEFRCDATVVAIEPHDDLRQDRNQSLAQSKLPIFATVTSKIEVAAMRSSHVFVLLEKGRIAASGPRSHLGDDPIHCHLAV